jgi:DSF synthase
MNAIVEFPTLTTINAYTQVLLEHDRELKTLFSWMTPKPRHCFTPTLLDEFEHSEKLLELHQGHINDQGSPARIDYVVYGNPTPGVFNLGGDLNMFVQSIMRQDRTTIQQYAKLCVDLIYRRHTGFGANITTIALVQGKALGGGFECALACDMIVAERSATFSLPESLFNLFPGMGALSFLARKVGLAKAEQICANAELYTAREMHELGVVDTVVEDGLGLETTRKIIAQRNRHRNTHRALKAAKNFYQPVTREELHNIVDVWTEAALQLETRDLRMMTRLIKAQDRIGQASPDEKAIQTLFCDSREARASA